MDGRDTTTLTAWSDSDWAGANSNRKSTGAYIVMLNGGCIGWRSFKQRCVALSSTGSEYIALSECCRAVVRVRRILCELGALLGPTDVHEDNQSCLVWAEIGGKRTKHIDVRYHYTRDVVTSGEARLVYCSTTDMLADALTKALGPTKFKKLVSSLAMFEEM